MLVIILLAGLLSHRRAPLSSNVRPHMDELSSAVHEKILALSADGDKLAASSQFESAIQKYSEAWALIPEPKDDWEASTWVLAAIGDACFLSKRFDPAHEAFAYSLACPSGFGNPFLHMRTGQCEFERGNLQAAADELCRAYALVGKEIFGREDPKYFEFLKTRIKPPAANVW